MSAPAASVARATRAEPAPAITQLGSHNRLLHVVSHNSTASRRGRPDAIIVPAARPASALDKVIAVAAQLGTYLVVLCSKQAKPDRVAERIRRHPGARGVAVRLGDDYKLPTSLRTMSDEFADVSGKRVSDLSAKRNFGLLLARRRGWNKIVFMDDDITTTATAVGRMAYQLDDHPIVGMACRNFPDNSVLCHARREAGFRQDVFLTGAVLGVNCSGNSVPFFPNVYNEDWFFFGDAAARHTLTKTGYAHQLEYKPFADPARAVHEEFGDLLAEGLYLLIENLGPGFPFREAIDCADAEFWESFIKARRRSLDETRTKLAPRVDRPNFADIPGALKSLDAADERYIKKGDSRITPERCVDFLRAWEQDDSEWRGVAKETGTAPTVLDAVASLGAVEWTFV
jgi:hypothetical protein